MIEAELCDWSFIKACICVHEMVTGKKPLEITIPTPNTFKVFGIRVKFHTYPHYLTTDFDTSVHHESPLKEKSKHES